MQLNRNFRIIKLIENSITPTLAKNQSVFVDYATTSLMADPLRDKPFRCFECQTKPNLYKPINKGQVADISDSPRG